MVEIRRLGNEGVNLNILVGIRLCLALKIVVAKMTQERCSPVGFNPIDERTALNQRTGVFFTDFDVRLRIFIPDVIVRAGMILMQVKVTAIRLSHDVTRFRSEYFIVVFTLLHRFIVLYLFLGQLIVLFLVLLILSVSWLILPSHLH